MKKLFKQISSVALATMLILGTNTVTTFASQKVNVSIDGRVRIFPDVEPFIDSNGRTQVPIRFVSEELGADVDWDSSTKTATIERNDRVVEMTIGKSQIVVDGETKKMDTSPMIYQGRTVVPLRFVSEGLGVDVNYDCSKNLVEITTDGNGTLPEPKMDFSEPVKWNWDLDYTEIEFPIKWMYTSNRYPEYGDGIIYDITLKNDNEIWFTTSQYCILNVTDNKPTLSYPQITFYNSKTGIDKTLGFPVGILKGKPQITYNSDGTITYKLETYVSDFNYNNYDVVKIGERNFPISVLK